MVAGTQFSSDGLNPHLASYPLLDALIERRSRRFGQGMHLNGGPLAYGSTEAPHPLTLEEEAALALAACGVTGYALGELPYDTGDVPDAGSGNMMMRFVGRTVASADALHTVILFVINDAGVWMLRRLAGLAKFARSRGGHLRDDPVRDRVATMGLFELLMYEYAAIEQGALLQNLALMTQALGLGGFPHYAAHPFIWFQVLGFRLEQIPFSRTIAAGPVLRGWLRAMRREIHWPTPVGLERNGRVLLQPFCPP